MATDEVGVQASPKVGSMWKRRGGQVAVETAPLDFARLGVQSRAYFDFGVVRFEFRGGAKSAGAQGRGRVSAAWSVVRRRW